MSETMSKAIAIYETALNYVSLYGFSVIPLIPGKKIPPFDWKEYQNRLPGESELKEWFLEKKYNNIGIITGAVSNLIVIDIDNKNGKNGFDYINGLDFTEIPSVVTPHNGLHLYFSYSEGVKTIASEKGIDIRSDGGYVVAPPSVIDGIKYEWKKTIELDKSNLLSIPEIFLSLDTDTKTHSLKPPKLLAKGTSLIYGETLSHSEGKIFHRWQVLERDENFIRFVFKFVFRCEPSKNMMCVLHAEKHASASVFFIDKAQRFKYKDFHDGETYSILDLLLTYFGIPERLKKFFRVGFVSFFLRAYNGNAKTEFETYSLLGDYDLRLAKTYLVIASLNELEIEPFLSVRSLASMLNLKDITYTNRLLNFLCLIGVLEKYERGERKANGFKLRNIDTSKLKSTLENLNGLDIRKLSKQEALKYFDIHEIEAIYKRKYKV